MASNDVEEVKPTRRVVIDTGLFVGGKRNGEHLHIEGRYPETLRVNTWEGVGAHIDYEGGGEPHKVDADFQIYRQFTLHDSGRAYTLYRHDGLPEGAVIPTLLQGYKP